MKLRRLGLLLLLLPFVLYLACSDDDDDDNDVADDDVADDDIVDDDVVDDDDSYHYVDDDTEVDDDTGPGDEILPSADYQARQAEYLQYCHDLNGPLIGGFHGQVCRIALDATEFNEIAIDAACLKIDNREDCADFDLNSLLRILYLYQSHPTLSPETLTQLEDTALGFKYWLDEPGYADMCWWSENHQILFHTAELLAGQLFRDEVFTNGGMTGADHIAHATPLVHRWLNLRGRFGFSEWHSNVYFNEDIPALTNLVDFAEDESIRTKAAMVLDVIAFDFANNYFQGLYATAHGRTYQSKLLGGLNDSTREAAWLMLGLGDYAGSGNFSATALASSVNYWPPVVLEDVAADALDGHEHRERVSVDLAEGPDWGIGYQIPADVMFWWGMSAYAAPQVITGTFQVVDDFDLWDGWLWRDIAFLRFLVGSPLLEQFSSLFEVMTRGPALETMNTYTYRTPHYQMSGAMDYNPGLWSGQTHIWQATIDPDAYVFTSAPGGLEGDYMAGEWTGGWLPRALLHENVAVILYDRVSIPILEQLLFVDYTHAYFPRDGFDEVVESAPWIFGRKGDSYVALFSDKPTHWAADPPADRYELIAPDKKNVWICELGCAADNGAFADFMDTIENTWVDVNGVTVVYNSPSLGPLHASWGGAFTVDGTEIDTGPFARHDNEYCLQEFGENRTIIELGGQRLDLNFETAKRRYWTDY